MPVPFHIYHHRPRVGAKTPHTGRTAAWAGLASALLLLAACAGVGSVSKGASEARVLSAYGEPDSRQRNEDIEVWQYCTSGSDSGEAKDQLRLVWLKDGKVAGESRHAYDLDGCTNLYVVDLSSPPHGGR